MVWRKGMAGGWVFAMEFSRCRGGARRRVAEGRGDFLEFAGPPPPGYLRKNIIIKGLEVAFAKQFDSIGVNGGLGILG